MWGVFEGQEARKEERHDRQNSRVKERGKYGTKKVGLKIREREEERNGNTGTQEGEKVLNQDWKGKHIRKKARRAGNKK